MKSAISGFDMLPTLVATYWVMCAGLLVSLRLDTKSSTWFEDICISLILAAAGAVLLMFLDLLVEELRRD